MAPEEHSASGIMNPEGSPDAGVTWHYGDPFAEQRAAERGAVVIDRSHRRVITLTGPERLSWLHSITSQHLTHLPDRTATEDLNLDGSGRVLDHFHLIDADGTVYLDTEPAALAPKEAPLSPDLATYLQRMVFRSQVQVQARDDLAVLTLLGRDAEELAAGVEGVRRSEPGEVNLIVPRERLRATFDALVGGGAPGGHLGLRGPTGRRRPRPAGRRHRRQDHPPRGRLDPHRRAPGQGLLSRAGNCRAGAEPGPPPRRLVLLHLDGSADARPATGDPVTLDGRTVGRLGTVVEHADYGPIALALIKRSIPDDAKLDAGGAAAAIDADVTPAADAGEQAGRSAVDRLRGR
ncbi:glycine cleavage system protein T [Tsukamurella sp. PLM1]|nr:glycine cleavage system protein T [Tsukamurella sp. PLM1]